jgi:hypothetical protein
MAEYYEIDFLPVHTAKSGDAIAMRFGSENGFFVHVVDGGYESTAPNFAAHIQKYYNSKWINRMVVSHPDKDHAEGLAPILEEFRVDELWMLRPWLYADLLVQHFARYTSAQRLRDRLHEDYPYIEALEAIALRRNIPIYEPFQGASIGPFTVLAPSRAQYFQLVVGSEKTPQPTADATNLLEKLLATVAPVVRFIKAGWASERFSTDETSTENEMSVIQYAELSGHTIVLTGDAGRGALAEAADYAPTAGLILPGVTKFQVPHHGGRRNVSTELLDRWLGPRLPRMLPAGSETFTAMISSAKEDPEHPRKAVLRAMLHRGAKVITTEDGAVRVSRNAPKRDDYHSLDNVPYPDEQEE